jgi:hypothetical protein
MIYLISNIFKYLKHLKVYINLNLYIIFFFLKMNFPDEDPDLEHTSQTGLPSRRPSSRFVGVYHNDSANGQRWAASIKIDGKVLLYMSVSC